jgi:hypothetical protein
MNLVHLIRQFINVMSQLGGRETTFAWSATHCVTFIFLRVSLLWGGLIRIPSLIMHNYLYRFLASD